MDASQPVEEDFAAPREWFEDHFEELDPWMLACRTCGAVVGRAPRLGDRHVEWHGGRGEKIVSG